MKKSNGCFREDIKRAFSAFAYEHSGEMLSRNRKRQVLSASSMDKAEQDNYSKVLNKSSSFKTD